MPASSDDLREQLQPLEPPPAPERPLSPREILFGQRILPERVVGTYDSDEWERFVREWASEGLAPEYAAVFRAAGAGDKGRDVVAYVTEDLRTSLYDNYQCKHHDHALAPHEVWLELGKLVWYTFQRDYRVPRRYYFVAPKGPGPLLLQMIEDPDQFRQGLIVHWEEKCARRIQRRTRIALAGEFQAYVDRFDFGIIRAVDPLKLIEQHQRARRYHAMRFGGGLQIRPPDLRPPGEPGPDEAKYVRHLLDAYGESLGGVHVPTPDALGTPTMPLRRHLTRQREFFFKAATLRQFERDSLPHDRGFEALMDQVYDGIIDTCDQPHFPDGLARVNATLEVAVSLNITSYALRDDLQVGDLKGVCHHLANEDRLCWCQREDAQDGSSDASRGDAA